MVNGPIAFNQDMLFAGAHEIRISGLLKEDAESAAVILLASRVYKAMERQRPELIKPKDIIIGG